MRLKMFLEEEDGAVTVDWVVLTAALVSLALLVISQVRDGVTELSDNMTSVISAQDVGGN